MAWSTTPLSHPTREERDLLACTSTRRALNRATLECTRPPLVTDAIAKILEGSPATIITPGVPAANQLFEHVTDLLPNAIHTNERTIEVDTGTLYVLAQNEFETGIQIDGEYLYITDADLQEDFVESELALADDVPLTVSYIRHPSFIDDSWEVLGPYGEHGTLVA